MSGSNASSLRWTEGQLVAVSGSVTSGNTDLIRLGGVTVTLKYGGEEVHV